MSTIRYHIDPQDALALAEELRAHALGVLNARSKGTPDAYAYTAGHAVKTAATNAGGETVALKFRIGDC
ncbi:MAG TPA: hypothetical protein VGD46_19560 [Rhizobacter sp.]